MRAPGFWQRPPEAPGAAARLLRPLGALYAAGTRRRLAKGGAWRPPVPVICAGNLTAGGAGKTPTVMALLERLSREGRGGPAMVVSRGYGGCLAGPVRVDPARHDAGDVGDEPLLLAAFAPVFVARDRAAAARAAVDAGAGALVMDDGLQNPALVQDLAILVVDAAQGFGNGLVLPAGPLREPVAAGMARAGLLLSIGKPSAQAAFDRRWGPAVAAASPALPRQRAELRALPTGMEWAGLNVLAFAGIARPQKFFATLEGLGARLVERVALDDHQRLDGALMGRLARRAAAGGLQMVTTEKDAVRLPAAYRGAVLTLPVRLAAADWSALDAALGATLAGAAPP